MTLRALPVSGWHKDVIYTLCVAGTKRVQGMFYSLCEWPVRSERRGCNIHSVSGRHEASAGDVIYSL